MNIESIKCADLEKTRIPHIRSCRECKASLSGALKAWQEMMVIGEVVEPPDPCLEMQRLLREHRRGCKKCQDNRAVIERMEQNGTISLSHQEILDATKKVAAKRKCFFPDTAECKYGIVKAHSVQEKLLEKIARDSHVYHFRGTYDNLLRNDGIFKPALIGLGNASTFTGFCGYHDNCLFAPVEKKEFSLNQKNVFLLAYRAICFELFNQEIWLELFPMYRELPRGIPMPFKLLTQMEISRDESLVDWSLRGLRSTKSDYDKVIRSQDFSEMNYYCVQIDTILPFLWSGVTSPEWDFKGRVVQRFSEFKRPAALTFSIVTIDSEALLIFAWLGDSDEIEKFIRSFHMLSDDELLEAVRRFVFELIENVYFQPDWWENNPEIQRFLEARIMANFKKRFRGSREQLLSDNYRFLAGKVASRKTTLKFE